MVATALPEQQELVLRGPQRDIFYDDRRYIYYKSGRGCGKTVSALMKIAGDIDEGIILPGARILCMAPTYPQLKKGTLVSTDRWLGKFDGDGVEPDGLDIIEGGVNGNEPERVLMNGITMYFRNASNPDQTRSHEVQRVWLDEPNQMKAGILQMTNANLRQFGKNAHYQTICTGTPRGNNWAYDAFVNPKTRFPEEKLGYYHITTVQAEKLGIARPGYVEEMGLVPGSAMYRQEVLGEEVAWTGRVFHYQPERDTPAPFITPRFKTVVGGVDIGTTAPTALILIGKDDAGKVWVFKEYYQRRADMHDWMKIAGEWTRDYRVRRWYIDSAANLELATMRSAGLPVTASIKAKDAAGTAVNYLNSLMERDMFRVSPICYGLIAELETYEHKEVQSGDEVTFLDKVKPNQPDHAIDALRYATAGLSMQRTDKTEGTWLTPSFGGR